MKTYRNFRAGSILLTLLLCAASHYAIGAEDQETPPLPLPEPEEKDLDPTPQPLGEQTSPGTTDSQALSPFTSPLNFKVDSQSGRFTYSIPIAVPPARQGAEPKLQLSYASGNPNGWCGVGWGLDIGQIERDTRKGPPIRWSGQTALSEYDDAQGFVFSMGGASGRLVLSPRANEYRLEIQTSRLVFIFERANNRWVVTDSGGNKFYFGQSSGTRMQNERWAVTGDGTGQTFRWVLDKVTDINGNTTVVEWLRDNRVLYPRSISYNGHTSLPGLGNPASVVFTLEDRPEGDVTWTYRAGYWLDQTKRLKTVETFISGSQRAARYELAYDPSPTTSRSLLKSISFFGSDNTTQFPAPDVPAVTFTYNDPSLELSDLVAWNRAGSSPDFPFITDRSGGENNPDCWYTLLDLDGDGRPDRVWRFDGGSGNYSWQIERNNGSSFDAKLKFADLAFTSDLGTSAAERAPYAGFGSSKYHRATELVIDMNGDGRPDRFYSNTDNSKQYVQLNTGRVGSGLGPVTEWPGWTGPYGLTWEVDDGTDTDSKLMMLDMNGDGKPDRIYLTGSGDTNCYVQYNTGSGWAPPVFWGTIQSGYLTRTHKTDTGGIISYEDTTVIFDINGDGLPDRVTRASTARLNVKYNRGDGFTEAMSLQVPFAALGATLQNIKSVGLVDWNGDGLLDVQTCYAQSKLWLNQGVYFKDKPRALRHTANLWGVQLTYPYGERSFAQCGTPAFFHYGHQVEGQILNIDINGDGLADSVVVAHELDPDTTGWIYDDDPNPDWVHAPVKANSTTLYAQKNQGRIPDLMTGVSSPLGGSLAISYTPSTHFDNQGADGAQLLPFPVYAVTQVTVNDGFDNLASTSYAYSGGFFDAVYREFRGFHKVEETDAIGVKTVTYFHQGGGYDGSAEGEYADSYAKKGIPYKIEVWGSAGTILHRTLNKIEVDQPEPGYYFPRITQTIKMDYADPTHYRATAEQLTYDLPTGNVLWHYKKGEIKDVNIANHTFSENDPADVVITQTTYKSLTNPDIVNKPDVITVSRAGQSDRKTRFNYESRGNLTSTERWLASGNRWVSSGETLYDALGNPYHTTDAAGVSTEVVYDTAFSTFPETRTVAPGTAFAMTTTTTYDSRSGKATTAANHLGVIVKTEYDPFFRPIATYVNQTPNAEPTLWRTRTDYYMGGVSGTTSNNKVWQRVYDPNDTLNGIETFTYLDGLGRAIQIRAESEIANTFRCSDTFYDDALNTRFSPVPYFGAGSDYAANTSEQLGTFTELDAAGRAWRTTAAAHATYSANRARQGAVTLTGGDSADSPVAPVTTAYVDGSDPWATIVTDQRGHATKSRTDAFGRVTNIINVATSQGDISTKYFYDLTGNLITVVDDSNNRTVISYDTLNRKTSVQDPDMGTWTYQYDDADRLADQYDAKNQRIHIGYEPANQLGRILTKEIYDAGQVLKRRVQYQYDAPVGAGCTVSLGQLAAITETALSCNCIGNQRFWSYDYKGRVLAEGLYAWPFGTFTTSQTYNMADQVEDLYYPNDIARVRHSYQNGALKKIQSLKGTGAASETFYELTSLNEFGQPLTYLTHNGQVTHTYEYYPASKRLKSLRAAKSGADLLYKTYAFDASANIKTITDNISSHSGFASGTVQNIQYDELNRLTSLADASATRTFSYTKLGNIDRNGLNGAANYVYGARPHAVTYANGKGYAYDANGNMVTRNAQTLIYDEENRLVQVTSGSSINVHFGYDSQGVRLWKFNKVNNTYTCFISPLYEYRESDSAGLCYVYANGQRVAAFRPTADVYQIGSNPLPVGDRLAALAAVGSRTAEKGLAWLLDFRRVNVTTATLAAAFTLLLLLAAFRLTGLRLRNCERRFYVLPLWQRGLMAALIPALLLATTEVHAAFVPGEVFYYYLTDHLGSSNITTDRAGNVIQQHEYAAYGTERFALNNAAGHPEYNLTHRFTGQVLDEDTGLYYYNARYYDAELGRFIQPDTIVPNPGDGQALNRYTYCANNPLNYVDPSGNIWAAIVAAIYAGLNTAVPAGIIGGAIGAMVAGLTGGNVGLGLIGGAVAGFVGGFGIGFAGKLGMAASGLALHGADLKLAIAIGGSVTGAGGAAAGAAIQGGDPGLSALIGAVSGGTFGYLDPPVEGSYGSFGPWDDWSSRFHVPHWQGLHVLSPESSAISSAGAVAAGVGAVTYLGQQAGDAGANRIRYDAEVRALDAFDNSGRSALKESFRARDPITFQKFVKSVRPESGPRAGSVGHANVPNPAYTAAGRMLKTAGRLSLAASLIVDVVRVATAENTGEALFMMGFGILGSLAGGTVGALAGGGVASFLTGAIGASAGGIAGEALGQALYRRLVPVIYGS